jgi:uncharacterized membrane protein YhaH (DUF805 family)
MEKTNKNPAGIASGITREKNRVSNLCGICFLIQLIGAFLVYQNYQLAKSRAEFLEGTPELGGVLFWGILLAVWFMVTLITWLLIEIRRLRKG